MGNIVGTANFILNKHWQYSSSVTKSANSSFNGRSACIFRVSTDYCINP
jgi:hypothetical protein